MKIGFASLLLAGLLSVSAFGCGSSDTPPDASPVPCQGEACDPTLPTPTPGNQGPSLPPADAGKDADGPASPCAGVTCNTPPKNSCNGDALVTYEAGGTCDQGQCSYAKKSIQCPRGCASGACIGDPCIGVTCNQPPAALCASSTDLKTFESQGTCAAGSCAYAAKITTCAFGCDSGVCKNDPCAGKTCNQPPANYCLDASTLRGFGAAGQCAGGSCAYDPVDKTCAFGCANGACKNDPCAGKTCNQPPASYCSTPTSLKVFAAAGQCAGGSCTYAPSEITCAFGCEGGACKNDPCAGKACNAPPATYCVGPATVRSFGAAGTCAGGACSYAPVDTTCPFGCDAGKCKNDPCAGVVCAAPPADGCIDPSTLRTYGAGGTCSGGACGYPHVDQTCPNGCAAGKCSAPVCGGVTCNAPPSAVCASATRLRTFAQTGSCGGGGACVYAALESECSEGCFNGACIAGSWRTEAIPVTLSASATSVRSVIDAGNNAHVAACEGGNGDVVHLFMEGGAWKKETVDPGLGAACAVAMAIGPTGQPVFAYYDSVNKDLRYAERSGNGTFTKLLVATAGDVGRAPSIDHHPTGGIAIGYLDATAGTFVVAIKNGATFPADTLGATAAAVSEVRFDGSGTLHAAAGGSTTAAPVLYGKRSGAAWQTRVVTTGGFVSHRGLGTSASGEPQLIFGVEASNTTRLATFGAVPAEVELARGGGGVSTLTISDRPEDRAFVYDTLPAYNTVTGPLFLRYDPVARVWAPQRAPTNTGWAIFDANRGPDARMRYLAQTTLFGAFPKTWALVYPPACTPSCNSRNCGGDGCGGSCGTCLNGLACGGAGTCGDVRVETVDVGDEWKSSTLDLRVDPNGVAHTLVGRTSVGPNARYLTRSPSGAWSSGSPASTATTTTGGLGLLANGNAVAVGFASPDLVMLTNQGAPSAWAASTLIANVGSSFGASVAVSPQDAVTVVYGQSLNGWPAYLMAASQQNGVFTSTKIVDYYGNDNVGSDPQIALDAAGKAHVLYRHYSGNGYVEKRRVYMEYATNESGAWAKAYGVLLTSDSATIQGSSPPQVAVDASGTVSAVYYAGVLLYATKGAGGAFTYGQAVPGATAQDKTFSYYVDALGRPTILATRPGAMTLFRLDGGVWTSVALPLVGLPSTAVAKAGPKPNVVFWERGFDRGAVVLRYARALGL